MTHQANAILGLMAQTSVHAGTGQNTGVIDLPIQREGHNGWPCVFGSAVKGALRARAEQDLENGKNNESVAFIFGPDNGQASDHAGALMVSDARLLLLPVRSLTSQFKWVTCPAAIERYARDAGRFGISLNEIDTLDLDNATAVLPESCEEDALFLEEYRFNVERQALEQLIDTLAALMDRPNAHAALAKQLAIVSNDMFAYLVEHATPVNAHIAIDSDTKMVKGGALWYEETLPPETLLYVGLSAVKSRAPRTKETQTPEMPATSILNAVTELFVAKPWLQLGGNETVGMGWCAVKRVGEGE